MHSETFGAPHVTRTGRAKDQTKSCWLRAYAVASSRAFSIDLPGGPASSRVPTRTRVSVFGAGILVLSVAIVVQARSSRPCLLACCGAFTLADMPLIFRQKPRAQQKSITHARKILIEGCRCWIRVFGVGTAADVTSVLLLDTKNIHPSFGIYSHISRIYL